jgi:DNA-binding NarL/FixJ family response regulator
MPARLLYLAPDLMVSVPIQEAARRAGMEAISCADPGDLIAAVSAGEARVVIVDMGAARESLRAIASSSARAGAVVVAFGPHVDVELRRMALEAGIKAVYPRSKFLSDVVKIVQCLAEDAGNLPGYPQ